MNADLASGLLHALDLRAEVEFDSLPFEQMLQGVSDVAIFAARNRRKRLDHDHFTAQAAIKLRHLQRDHAAADDGQAPRQLGMSEPVAGMDHIDTVDSLDRRNHRARAGVEDHVICEEGLAAGDHAEAVTVAAIEPGLTANEARVLQPGEAALET